MRRLDKPDKLSKEETPVDYCINCHWFPVAYEETLRCLACEAEYEALAEAARLEEGAGDEDRARMHRKW